MRTHTDSRDQGSVLLLVLVVSVVLALVVLAMATYSTTTLRYGRVVEDSAKRLATAQAGMDNALESIERNESKCVLTAIEMNGSVPPFSLGTPINGIDPVIECVSYTGNVTPVDNYAVILTGQNGQTDEILTIQGGGDKQFGGNVFMNRVPNTSSSLRLLASLEVKDGNLRYFDPTCSAPTKLTSGSHNLTFTTGYGLSCSNNDWASEFSLLKPVQPASFGGAGTITPPASSPGCSTFTPGTYTSPPVLTEWNYFKPGNYFFNFPSGDDEWSIDNSWVLAGNPGTAGPDIEDHNVSTGPTNSVNWYTHPCRGSVEGGTPGGAAFYFGGSSHIVIGNSGSLEVTGNVEGNYNIGLFALEGSSGSTLGGDARLIRTQGGNGKQMSIRGLVWAPNTGVEFANLANDVRAALTGGAVLSELDVGAANAAGLQISVETRDPTKSFVVTSTATNSGTTTVRTQLIYRSDGTNVDYAVLSRRVLDITPE